MDETQSLLTDAERAEGWIEYSGSGLPDGILAYERVDFLCGNRSRSKSFIKDTSARCWKWTAAGEHFDRIAWRPHGQTAKVEPKRSQTELAAFEDWIARERPSGDAEAVQFAWSQSGAYADWLDESQPPPDPNADMLARDQPRLVAAPVSTPAPRVERSPLLTIAPIPRTGFSFWGEQS